MIVHALFWNEPGHAFTLLGIYSSLEKAENAWVSYCTEFGEETTNYKHWVHEIVLDDEPTIIEPY